jgi:predicted nucleotidyltransferase
MVEIPRAKLATWTASKPTIQALYLFGSYAHGEARSDSNLDLAFEFIGIDEDDAKLMSNAALWKAELNRITGIVVKDVYLRASDPVKRSRAVVEVCRRADLT